MGKNNPALLCYGDPRRASVKTKTPLIFNGENATLLHLSQLRNKQLGQANILDTINLKHRIWPFSYRSIFI